jgi:hypothetical protein
VGFHESQEKVLARADYYYHVTAWRLNRTDTGLSGGTFHLYIVLDIERRSKKSPVNRAFLFNRQLC